MSPPPAFSLSAGNQRRGLRSDCCIRIYSSVLSDWAEQDAKLLVVYCQVILEGDTADAAITVVLGRFGNEL
jgi:hypothetical protein